MSKNFLNYIDFKNRRKREKEKLFENHFVNFMQRKSPSFFWLPNKISKNVLHSFAFTLKINFCTIIRVAKSTKNLDILALFSKLIKEGCLTTHKSIEDSHLETFLYKS